MGEKSVVGGGECWEIGVVHQEDPQWAKKSTLPVRSGGF